MAVAIEPGLKFTVRPFDRDAVRENVAFLDIGEVHVWYRPLQESALSVSALQELLSPDERERALRFRFEKHRNQFVVTRATLRSLLGGYLGQPPGQISFLYSDHGKPSVGEVLDFNLSHTEGMGVFAFTRGRRIGVDVEQLRTNFEATEIAERFFSAAERAALRNVPATKRDESFFRIWTRKEAYIKALGEGLSHPLHEFDVSLDEAAELLATRPDASEVRRWQLEDVPIGPGFIAAVAVETEGVAAK